MATIQKDDGVLKEKIALRRLMLGRMQEAGDDPVIIETHGGVGQIWAACYAHITQGVVFETNPQKTIVLVEQRPTWSVYEADCVKALRAGAGAHLAANVLDLDLDPYGDPWPAICAFFESERPTMPRLYVVVNDGLRRTAQLGRAWAVHSLAPVVARYGNDLYQRYLAVCQELMTEIAAKGGYALDRFAGYYCGAGQGMTHYLAILSSSAEAASISSPNN